MPKARTVKTSKKRKLTGKGFKDVAKKVAKVAIPIALAVAAGVAAHKVHVYNNPYPTDLRARYAYLVPDRWRAEPEAA